MGSSQSHPAGPSRRRNNPQQQPQTHLAPPSTRPTLTSSSSSASGSRFSSFRRLSALGRRESHKRDRAPSAGGEDEGDTTTDKRRRLGDNISGYTSHSSSPLAGHAALPLASPSRESDNVTHFANAEPPTPSTAPTEAQHGSLPTSPGPPISPTLPVPYPRPGLSSPPASPPIDPLLPDRLDTLSTIRETLGPSWPAMTHDPETTDERLQRISTALDRIEQIRAGHRRHTTSDAAGNASAGASTSGEEPTITNLASRVFSRLGLGSSTSTSSPSDTDSDLSASADTSMTDRDAETDSLTGAVADDLTERIARARAELEEVQSQRRTARSATGDAGGGDSALTADAAGQAGAGGQARVPTGAMVVIQGLAQTPVITRSSSPAGSVSGGESSNTTSRGGLRPRAQSSYSLRPRIGRSRSSSESHLSEPTRNRANSETDVDATNAGAASTEADETLNAQARMISELLTVAASATASTLISPSTLTSGIERSPTSPIQSFMNRFRSQRQPTTTTAVETALENHFRNATRHRRRVSQASDTMNVTPPGRAPPEARGAAGDLFVSDEFQTFLEGMQGDLLGAIRQYATLGLDEEAEEEEVAAVEVMDGLEGQSMSDMPHAGSENGGTAAEDVDSEIRREILARLQPQDPTQSPAEPGAAEQTIGSQPSADSATATEIPAFHFQPGQNRPAANTAANRFGVSGGTDGQPRRLNFFRAHILPPVLPNSDAPAPAADDPNVMLPCVFVGVRSINQNVNISTDDLDQHADAAFGGDETRSETDGAGQDSTATATASAPSSRTSERPSTPMPGSTFSSPAEPARRSLRERVLERLNPRRSNTTSRAQNAPGGPMNTYLVYVIGGFYPRSHPVLAIPALLTGDPLTDEEMTLIGELMGPGKPPTATKEEIDKAGLEVFPAQEIAGLAEAGKVLSNCVERCLVCLGDYEDGEQCRVLNCRHAFHKDCVDEWLSKGRNSCPACRTEAVAVKAGPVAASANTDPIATEGGMGAREGGNDAVGDDALEVD